MSEHEMTLAHRIEAAYAKAKARIANLNLKIRPATGLQIVDDSLGGTSISQDDEKGPIAISLQQLEAMGLRDEQLEAIMLHELTHPIIYEHYGIDEDRDDENWVDQWMREYGFDYQAALVAQLGWHIPPPKAGR